MSAIDKVIQIASNEIGYLEKSSNSDLENKTNNAGYNNYTKYWQDIAPSYQGQPWCAIFVNWCFEKAFGKDNAKKLLKHYPYTYCPTMANLFTLNANPKVGDIVIFYYHGEFAHTGIVVSVSGDYFETIEGNTSSGSSIVPNGGGVYRKGYYNSNLIGTKFCTPDYSLVEEKPKPKPNYNPLITYQSHLQNIGWQGAKHGGEVSGTVGEARRLEALTVKWEGKGTLYFQGHVQSLGWSSVRNSGEVVGTVGESLRLEAVKIWLDGSDRKLKYRVHIQNKGWTDWVSEKEIAGTTGQRLRIEAIEIQVE